MSELITEQQVEDNEQLNFDLLVLENQQLKQQLESCQSELSGISGQLKEAVEVIEKELICDTITIPTSTGLGVRHKDNCFKCAFLAKIKKEGGV